MNEDETIPTGGIAFEVMLEPSAEAQRDFTGWRQAIKTSMKAEGITISSGRGGHFKGYYFPDTAKPARWLS